jgi:hypothetical protein
MKTKVTFLLFATLALFFASCSKYPPSSDRLLEDLAIVTQYDVKADFNQYKTYSLSDKIIKVTDKDTTILTGTTATAVLDAIARNLEARGFVKPTGEDKPDLGITVTYYQNTYIYAYYPDYWWGYPYYGWGWYYPYYPTYYSSYTAGAANILLVDLKYPAPNNQLYVRWNAYIRGLLTSTHTTSEITGSIDQAFIQTPQLVTSAK